MAPPWVLWLYVIGFHAATAQVKELPEENEEVIPGLHSGLLFQPRGLLTLATGVWTAVVRFKHDDVRRQAKYYPESNAGHYTNIGELTWKSTQPDQRRGDITPWGIPELHVGHVAEGKGLDGSRDGGSRRRNRTT